MAIPTTERLAIAIIEASGPDWMVAKARAGYYDDYKSPIATPLMELRQDALDQGLTSIAHRVIDGDFDATREESQAWFESEGRSLLDTEA
ncbi:hypothetical protein LCGC14_1003080 [marine sediment metagenome]|uniref:Uncharacterized protein n=1 Tax=marine sediment metagenome TaxID=412755 RepID=A0A0F9R8J1_9ZZZZ